MSSVTHDDLRKQLAGLDGKGLVWGEITDPYTGATRYCLFDAVEWEDNGAGAPTLLLVERKE